MSQNLKLFREMSEPFPSEDAANAALDAFNADVAAAREKHKITNVLVVASFSVEYGSGEGEAIAHSTFGDLMRAESLAAYAYGQEGAKRREMMSKMMAGKTR